MYIYIYMYIHNTDIYTHIHTYVYMYINIYANQGDARDTTWRRSFLRPRYAFYCLCGFFLYLCLIGWSTFHM
jgi:hypothetical protein